MRQQQTGEICITKGFMVCTRHQISCLQILELEIGKVFSTTGTEQKGVEDVIENLKESDAVKYQRVNSRKSHMKRRNNRV
jgi:hypothetical protein